MALTYSVFSCTVKEVKRMQSGAGKPYVVITGQLANGAHARFPLFGNLVKRADELDVGSNVFVIGSVEYLTNPKTKAKRYGVNVLEFYSYKHNEPVNTTVLAGRVLYSAVAESGDKYGYISVGMNKSLLVKFTGDVPEKGSYIYAVCSLEARGEFTFEVVVHKWHPLTPFTSQQQVSKSESHEQSGQEVVDDIPF